MISFHTPLSPDRRKMMIADSSRKRKWDDVEEEEEEEKSKVDEFEEKKRPRSRKRGSSTLDLELLHLEARAPVEWQRCLDIQRSGEEVHFYEGTTNERTSKDSDMDSTARRTVRLNLELNLQPYAEYLSPQEGETTSSTKRHPIVVEEEEEEEEMVATVCMRCHMLVMLCVSRPSCPNCKFVHPKPDQILFKPPPKCTSTAQLLC